MTWQPGYETHKGTPSGECASEIYNEEQRLHTLTTAILPMLRKPPAPFEKVLRCSSPGKKKSGQTLMGVSHPSIVLFSLCLCLLRRLSSSISPTRKMRFRSGCSNGWPCVLSEPKRISCDYKWRLSTMNYYTWRWLELHWKICRIKGTCKPQTRVNVTQKVRLVGVAGSPQSTIVGNICLAITSMAVI